MKIVNLSTNEVLSDNAEIREGFTGRFLGLMLSKRKDIILVAPREGVRETSIHMFGMLYPIDVIWLNSRKEVVDLKRGVRPFNILGSDTWKIYKPKVPSKYVIELGVGNPDARVDDVLEFRA